MVRFRPLDRPLECEGKRSDFSAPYRSTVALLARELRLIKATNALMLVDFREQDFRVDGMPRADRRARTPGLVLTFDTPKSPIPLRYEAATFSRFEDNVRAVGLSLESLRAVDRYGITKRGEQYAGWAQLPSGSGDPDAERGRQLVDARYDGSVVRALKGTHPDKGGNASDFADVKAFADKRRLAGASA